MKTVRYFLAVGFTAVIALSFSACATKPQNESLPQTELTSPYSSSPAAVKTHSGKT
ncbi:MAG: hypothetical protein AAF226_14665 [Verrucomicrobiota bacterium]